MTRLMTLASESIAAVLPASNPIAGEISMSDWLQAGLIISGTIMAIVATYYALRIAGRRLRLEPHMVELARRFLIAIEVGVAAFYLLGALDVRLTPLLGGLGISTIIVTLALQPVFGNLVGSVLLHGSRTFRPGDQIATNGISGTVVDINSRSVEIIDFDGVSNFVPNLMVLESPVSNRTAESIRRTVLAFQVGYGTDLRFAQKSVQHAIRQIDGITEIPTAEVLVQSFGDSGVNMKALFWHPSEELTAQWTISEVLITIRETLAENDITIPYPHVVLQRPRVLGPNEPESDKD